MKFKLLAGFLVGLLCSLISPLKACEWEFDALIGYRYDKVTTQIKVYDPEDVFILKDDLHAKNIRIYEAGLKGRVTYCHWVLKGFGTIGKVTHGDYHERVESQLGDVFKTKASIYKGTTRDASIGLGYLFSCWNWIYLTPFGGWSYDYQRIKIKNPKTNGEFDSVLDNLSYRTQWEGPWLGLESGTCFCGFDFRVGYEYHCPRWHAKWLLDGPDVAGEVFSDKRHAHDAYGNVFYLEGNYVFWDCLTIGAEVKYQYWKAKNGRETPIAGSFSDVGLNDTEVDKVPTAIWRSWEFQLTLGYNF